MAVVRKIQTTQPCAHRHVHARSAARCANSELYTSLPRRRAATAYALNRVGCTGFGIYQHLLGATVWRIVYREKDEFVSGFP